MPENISAQIYDAMAAGFQFNHQYIWDWVQDDYMFGTPVANANEDNHSIEVEEHNELNK
jgi:hypothetical protein